ncbi:MAG: rRNA maturation RNase YbeY [Clostridia bacterium]|nr:rRNA maturation RNase YbeY [Clostridia bacterium]
MKSHRITITKGEQKPPFSFLRVIRKSIKATLAHRNADLPCAVDVSLVSEAEIQVINAEKRDIDSVTDVLSFPQLDIQPGQALSEVCDAFDLAGGRVLLGDVVLCYPKALKQAIEYGHSFKREIGFLTVHSILHLLGYDHMEEEEEKVMHSLTEEILASIGLAREE